MLTWLLPFVLYAMPQGAPLCEPPHHCVTVPKVIGLTVKVAEATLADAGLRCEVREVPDRKTPRGIVVGQGPGPGQRVMINYEVRVHVAEGPAPKP